jgi:hypothetical protein
MGRSRILILRLLFIPYELQRLYWFALHMTGFLFISALLSAIGPLFLGAGTGIPQTTSKMKNQ